MSNTVLLTVGGVPVEQQTFSWALSSGVDPYMTQITLPLTLSEELVKVQNPTEVHCQIEGGFGRFDLVDFTIKNVYLVEPRKVNAFEEAWTLADGRFKLKGKIAMYAYNMTRVRNRKGLGAVSVEGKPSELRKDFDLFAKGRYIPWSIKDAQAGTPWTVLEILKLELEAVGITVKEFGKDDESYFLENLECPGQDVSVALRNLMALSRYEMGITIDGEIYLYSMDYWTPDDIVWIGDLNKRRAVTGSMVFGQDRAKIRPKTISVWFERKEEVWLTYTKESSSGVESEIKVLPKAGVWTDSDIEDGRVIGVENVIPISYPVTDSAGNDYKVGEWVTLAKYLELFGKGLTETDIQSQWFSSKLEAKYINILNTLAGGVTEGNEQFGRNIIGNLRNHYRQTFRIDPFFMDLIDSWETRRVGIVDNYSHFNPPSPLFSDYTIVPHFKNPLVAKRLASWDSHIISWSVNTQDKYRTAPTAGTVSMVNQALGIFRISYPSTMFSAIKEIIPFALVLPPDDALGNINKSIITPTYLATCKLSSTFEMQTIVSVVWNQGVPTLQKYKGMFYDFPTQGGEWKDEVEKFSRSEYARYGIERSVSEGPDEVLSASPSRWEFVNESLIDTVGKGEAARTFQQFKDYLDGSCSLAGLVLRPLFGNMNAITIQISPGSQGIDDPGLTSTYSFKPLMPFSLEQKVNQDTINFLHRHVSRGDNWNDLKGL